MDGGVDVPYADPDAGVFEVASAVQPDGGTLGQGWYLTRPRMQKVGEHIVELESRTCPEPTGGSTSAFLMGAGVGGGVVLIAVLVILIQGAGK